MLPEPPELGNEDPVFLSLLERARAQAGPRPDGNPYPALWFDAYFGSREGCGAWSIRPDFPAAERRTAA